jgi:protein SCO1/2
MNRPVAATVLGLLLATSPAAWAAGGAVAPAAVSVQSPLTFHDQADRTVTLPDGRIWVVSFFFGSCKTACPIILHNMATIAARLPAEQRSKVGFAAISFDPDRDQPERLRQLAQQHGLDPLGVQLLRGDAPAIQAAVRHFGFDYAPDGEGGFRHANLIAVMDGQGKPLRHVYGLQPDLDRILRSVAKAL